MIYLQSEDGKIPFTADTASAMYGAKDSKIPYCYASTAELLTGKFDDKVKDNLFVGTVEFMKIVWDRIRPNYSGIQVKLPLNSNRPSNTMPLGDALKLTPPIFIKPCDIKVFTGFLYEGFRYGCLDDIDMGTMVYVYEPFKYDISSEWRAYIHRNILTDLCCYDGEFRCYPDVSYIEQVIRDNKNFPNTYTVDVAVLDNKETVVVEFNDMWAIGNYGVPNWFYVDMLSTRYFDIVKQLS